MRTAGGRRLRFADNSPMRGAFVLQPRRCTTWRPRLFDLVSALPSRTLDDLPNEGGLSLEIPWPRRPSAPDRHAKGNVGRVGKGMGRRTLIGEGRGLPMLEAMRDVEESG
jgi:hypothetical protein